MIGKRSAAGVSPLFSPFSAYPFSGRRIPEGCPRPGIFPPPRSNIRDIHVAFLLPPPFRSPPTFLPRFVRPQGTPPTWHLPLVTALPSAVQARSCPRSGFHAFQCSHPSRTPSHPRPRNGIRDILVDSLLPPPSRFPPAGLHDRMTVSGETHSRVDGMLSLLIVFRQ